MQKKNSNFFFLPRLIQQKQCWITIYAHNMKAAHGSAIIVPKCLLDGAD